MKQKITKFVLKIELINEELIKKINIFNKWHTLNDNYRFFTIDDLTQQENFEDDLDKGVFSSESYIKNNKHNLLIFQKPLIFDDIFYTKMGKECYIFTNDLTYLETLTINFNAMYDYLNRGFLVGKKTFFNGINKMLPGELIKISMKYGNINFNHCWLLNNWIRTIFSTEYINSKKSLIINKLKKLIDKSIEGCLNPSENSNLAILLSGGVDSSIITYLLSNKIKKHHLYAYTGWFNSTTGKVDHHNAMYIANRFNVEHKKFYINKEIFDKAVNNFLSKITEPPSGAPAIIESYLVSKAKEQNVKIIFNGECADPLFGGGKSFLVERYRTIARIIHNLNKIMPILDHNYRKKIMLNLSEKKVLYSQMKMWLGEVPNGIDLYDTLISWSRSRLDSVSVLQMFIINPPFAHSKIKLSKSINNIRYALPYKNLELFKFAINIHPKVKIKFFKEKYILREAYKKEYSKNLKKRSYKPPSFSWINKDVLFQGDFPVNQDPHYDEKKYNFGLSESKLMRYYITNLWVEKFKKRK